MYINFCFKRTITFHALTIRKGYNPRQKSYKNICLVLNGDVENEVCTDDEHGFKDRAPSLWDDISWDHFCSVRCTASEEIHKVELYFREPYAEALHCLDDLKILWEPALVWKGDTNLATITTSPENKLKTSNLFDSKVNTVWYPIVTHGQKSIAVTFAQPIKFSELIIVKPTLTLPQYFGNRFKEQFHNNYANICLVLDDREVRCTDESYGFSGDSEDSDTIAWRSVSMAKKVELVFHSYGRAKLAEMEIVYYNFDRCKFLFAKSY